jgi:hypothetical protein
LELSDESRIKADANDPKKVFQWLIESEAQLKGEGIVKEKLVFSASGSDGAGKNRPTTSSLQITIMRGTTTSSKGPRTTKPLKERRLTKGLPPWQLLKLLRYGHGILSCSMLMKVCETQTDSTTEVLTRCKATPKSFWFAHKLPNVYNAGSITEMNNNNLTSSETAGKIPVPAKPAGCKRGSRLPEGASCGVGLHRRTATS